jgi:hypothetical protein
LELVRAVAEWLERAGTEGSDAVGRASKLAIEGHGLDPDKVQEALARGVEDAREAMRAGGNGVLREPPGSVGEVGAKTRAPGGRRHLVFGRLADVKAEPVRWLWPNRIARKFVLFTGPPDVGKTLTAIDVMARVTRGAEWPDGSGVAPLGSVVILTAEDGIADTIRPRADAANVDNDRVHFVRSVIDAGRPATFSIQDDLILLAAKLKELRDVVLIIVDPITAYLGAGKIDTHKMADVRSVLSPLKEFAEEHSVAILGLTHPAKAVTRAMNAVSGSQAFIAAARATWLFTLEVEDDKETGRTLMTPVKNNLATRQSRSGLAFRIETRKTEGIIAPAVVWDHEPVTTSADEALAAVMGQPGNGENRSALERAMQFLEEELVTSKAGRVETSIIEAQARKAGIFTRTLDRARARLKIVSERDGFGANGKFYLRWPDESSKERQDTS